MTRFRAVLVRRRGVHGSSILLSALAGVRVVLVAAATRSGCAPRPISRRPSSSSATASVTTIASCAGTASSSMTLVSQRSDRVRLRELGSSTNGAPFIALEISAPDTLREIDRYKALERKLYFQGGAPTDAERDEIFRHGKAVVLITCSIHATEIGASQMTLELVHRLATEDSPTVREDPRQRDLHPRAQPESRRADHGDRLVQQETWAPSSPTARSLSLPPAVRRPRQQPRHVHVHAEGKPAHGQTAVARLVSVRLARRAPDGQPTRRASSSCRRPIRSILNVHPLIYRWNGIFGQSQAASLEAGRQRPASSTTRPTRTSGRAPWPGAAGGTTRSAC